MANRIRLPRLEPIWESDYLNRRQFLRQAGWGAAALAAIPLAGCGQAGAAGERSASDNQDAIGPLSPGIRRPDILKLFPAKRDHRFDLKGKLTDELVAGTYNNFYEFTDKKDLVWRLVQAFEPDPWTIEITGECHKPRKFDIDQIMKFAQQERTYRFRCVEAWAMDVPWTGFELGALLKQVEPTSDAKFVRFVTARRPDQMPGIKASPQYPWPYFEALRMDEAMCELTLLATGIFGRPLPRQHGAPFRVIVPWKYGYKSPKSIVKIELVTTQPKTFWETVSPREYPFPSNVNPRIPHPRWSQASERVIGTRGRRRTLPYNGYGDIVAKLYA